MNSTDSIPASPVKVEDSLLPPTPSEPLPVAEPTAGMNGDVLPVRQESVSASPAPVTRGASAQPVASMPSRLPKEVLQRIIALAVLGASPLTRYAMLRSASLVAKQWTAPAQQLLCREVFIVNQGMANRWVQSDLTSRLPCARLEIDGRYGAVDANVTEQILGKVRGVERLRIDFVRGLSAKILVLPNLAGLKSLVLHCKIMCDPTPLAIPYHLTHLTLGGSYFPISLTQLLLAVSAPTLKSLVLTLQAHHSPHLRDEILRYIPSLVALEALTDWARPSEDTTSLLFPALPQGISTLQTGFNDKARIAQFVRSLVLPGLPNLRTIRCMYLTREDFAYSPDGQGFLAQCEERGIALEFGFERKDLREEPVH
ncbi:hypothetical protein JCM10213_001488 [Rhodosporidiobolus nylandii]